MRRLGIAAVGALLLSAAPAHAATFNVTTNQDLSAGCTQVACSLRGALSAAIANGSLEDDVINVPAGTYAAAEFLLTNAAATRITIRGAGANSTFIEPSGQNRLFNLQSSGSITLTRMTIRGGRPTSGTGGNIAVGSMMSLTLADVRVTDGRSPAGSTGGGGISAAGSTAVTISRSVIDGNNALGSGEGGGIWMPGQTSSTQLTITDSTITRNDAANGGAIATTFNSASGIDTKLRGVTVAFNTARDGGLGGVGGIQTDTSRVVFQGSVIAGNTSTINLGGSSAQVPTNCAIGGDVTDEGGNVEDQNQCALTASSATTTDPQLATTLDGSEPPALALPETSPAVDFADCDGRDFDQRAMPRPLGARCDAGAYEFDPRPETDVTGVAPPFTFSSPDAGSTFECSLNGGTFVACASPYDPAAGPGTHTLAVRAVDPQGNRDGSPATVTFTIQPPPVTPTPTPTATATAPPNPTPTVTPTVTPVVNQTIVVGPARGTVRVKLRGSRRYQNLDATQGIPVGSTVDTRKGRVTLTSIPKTGAAPETAVFYDGIFRVTQTRGVTNLTLTEQLARCPKKGRAATAAKKKTRKLWGKGKGAFRTTGRYSAATVRGTTWLVQDSCAGTLTRVTQGSVTVQHRNKRIVVRAGKRYLARPR